MAVTEMKDVYIGDLRKQLRDGYGVYTYKNKFFRYEGEWLNGKKHGHGKFSLADGSYYEGQFVHGEINGHGFKYFALSQNTYSGEFADGELTGQGVMKYADGSTYEGEWQHNKREGYGIFKSADGSVYQGNYYDHKRHGHGSITFKNVERYEGDWVCDKRQGHGEWTAVNGDVYVGQWRNDLYNGQGRLTSACSGAMYEGLWINGWPASNAIKLLINGAENQLSLMPGQSFSICVECVDEEGFVMEDYGREIELIVLAKSKNTASSASKLNSKVSVTNQSKSELADKPKLETANSMSGISIGSFSAAKDVEEWEQMINKLDYWHPVIRYSWHLTDDSAPSVCPAAVDMRSESDVEESSSNMIGSSPTVEAVSLAVEGALSTTMGSSAKVGGVLSAVGGASLTVDGAPATAGADEKEFVPVPTARTSAGRVSFHDVFIPVAPPLPSSLSHTLSEVEQSVTAATGDVSQPLLDNGAIIVTQSLPPSSTNLVLAQSGEYVIVARDITAPAFLNITLKPAMLAVSVVGPKKLPSGLDKKSLSQVSVKSSKSTSSKS